MAAINFDSQAVKKQAKLLEEAADQIQNQTIKVINAANEAVAASWSGKAGGIFRDSFLKRDRCPFAGCLHFHG